jgi:uncharacterized protein YpmB
MQGISTIIVTILLLMISVSLASFGYIFFTQVMSSTTQAGTEAIEQVSTSLLAGMKIDSISTNSVYVRNTGKVNLTQFAVFVNDALVSSSAPSSVLPGDVATITLSSSLNSGDVVKVTSGQGAIAIKSFD